MSTADLVFESDNRSECRDSVYSPGSTYSTHSHEVKYIFDPVDDRTEEYEDYSQIAPRAKQPNHYLSHTPRTISASSQRSSKDNRASNTPREDIIYEHRNSYRDRTPISPVNESVYSPSQKLNNSTQRTHSVVSDTIYASGSHFSPLREPPLYPYAKHFSKRNNQSLSQSFSQSGYYSDNGRTERNTPGSMIYPYKAKEMQHYQVPHVQRQQPQPQQSYQPHQQYYPLPPSARQEPPYPHPPRYNYQQHIRRKTWSPPALKITLLNNLHQENRISFSNDSIDVTEDDNGTLERRSQSVSQDLDTTPPRLAPISGVLAQKPGPNLIRPIAFKPPQTDALSNSNAHQSGTGAMTVSPRPQGLKLGTGMLGVRTSPESQIIPRTTSLSSYNPKRKTPTNTDNLHHITSAPALFSEPQNNFHSNSANTSNLNSSTCSHQSNSTSSQLEDVFNNDFPRPSDRPDSVPSFNASRVSSHVTEGVLQTPSPSDSGVGELEAILREKDAEINTLREVMERNERAIFQVYEERRSLWIQDAQELKEEYERKLKIQSRKSYKTEQVLSLQVYKLQQEQKTLQEENSKLSSERDGYKEQLEAYQKELEELKENLKSVDNKEINSSDEFQSEITSKNKELISLKSTVHTHQLEMQKKNKELSEKSKENTQKCDEIRLLREELERIKNPAVLVENGSQTHVPSEVSSSENVKPSMLGEREKTINGLQDELMELKMQVLGLQEQHDKEKEQWLDEKNKVVRYQKQLQLNYVQMQRKNATLETEVQQLTLELENRDMKLLALNGEESVC